MMGLRRWVLVAAVGRAGPGRAATAPRDRSETPAKAAIAAEEREAPRHPRDESLRTSPSIAIGGRALGDQTEASLLVAHVNRPRDEDAISSAYVSACNDCVGREPKFGDGQAYKTQVALDKAWDDLHRPPGVRQKLQQAANVKPDLAAAMKLNANLRVMLNGGDCDLLTPYFAATYELHHLPLPPAIAALEANVAAFVRRAHGTASD